MSKIFLFAVLDIHRNLIFFFEISDLLKIFRFTSGFRKTRFCQNNLPVTTFFGFRKYAPFAKQTLLILIGYKPGGISFFGEKSAVSTDRRTDIMIFTPDPVKKFHFVQIYLW